MAAHPDFDPESLQSFLANGLPLREGNLDDESLAAITEIQRAIGESGADVDHTISLIAEAARQVANASGVGVALLQGDQLIHRAGSGIASENIGRHFTAMFSAQSQPRPVILRVEDAQTDTRIEADICRQFESQALLMLPIFRDRVMVGVLEVFFAEPHSFDSAEVRTYQLMSTLVGYAISKRIQHLEQNVRATPSASVSHAIWRLMSEPQQVSSPRPALPEPIPFPAPASAPWYSTLSESAAERLAEWSSWCISRALPLVGHFKPVWALAIVPLLIGIAIAVSIAHHRGVTARATDPAIQTPATSTATPAPVPVIPAALPLGVRSSHPERDAQAPNSSFKRVRIGENETDYVTDDVVVRHFGAPVTASRVPDKSHRVEFGKDVTVRYFDQQASASSPDQARTTRTSK